LESADPQSKDRQITFAWDFQLEVGETSYLLPLSRFYPDIRATCRAGAFGVGGSVVLRVSVFLRNELPNPAKYSSERPGNEFLTTRNQGRPKQQKEIKHE
jgi:hypothetical protein